MIYRLYIKDGEKGKYQHERSAALLSAALLAECGIDFESEELVYNKYGKPSLKNHPNINYNITHCDGCVAVVINKLGKKVGIDAEKIRPFNPFIVRKVLSSRELSVLNNSPDRERSFFRFWVLKESYVKALGIGLSFGLKNIEFGWDSAGNISCSDSNAKFTLLEDSVDYILCTCIIE